MVYVHAAKQWYEWGGHYRKPDKMAKVCRIAAGQLADQYLIRGAELGKELEAAEEAAQEDESKSGEAVKLKNHIKSLR